MNILITGADQPLGRLLSEALGKKYNVHAVGRDDCDHRDIEAIGARCQGMDVLLHCDIFDAPFESDVSCLDWASRGTYVMMQAALLAGVARVIVASKLSLFDSYPDGFVIDETWQPQPDTHADSLAPYLAELTCREFARQGGVNALALRLGPLGHETGTKAEDVILAFEGALHLEMESHGYRWQVFHISSLPRFATGLAERVLQHPKEGH